MGLSHVPELLRLTGAGAVRDPPEGVCSEIEGGSGLYAKYPRPAHLNAGQSSPLSLAFDTGATSTSRPAGCRNRAGRAWTPPVAGLGGASE